MTCTHPFGTGIVLHPLRPIRRLTKDAKENQRTVFEEEKVRNWIISLVWTNRSVIYESFKVSDTNGSVLDLTETWQL